MQKKPYVIEKVFISYKQTLPILKVLTISKGIRYIKNYLEANYNLESTAKKNEGSYQTVYMHMHMLICVDMARLQASDETASLKIT